MLFLLTRAFFGSLPLFRVDMLGCVAIDDTPLYWTGLVGF
jgi:hypothetical protein